LREKCCDLQKIKMLRVGHPLKIFFSIYFDYFNAYFFDHFNAVFKLSARLRQPTVVAHDVCSTLFAVAHGEQASITVSHSDWPSRPLGQRPLAQSL
jgi:hypothetical protein